MNSDNLVKMANQIGTFFEAMPDREEAVADIAGHIKRFWEPRMRRALLARMDSGGDAGMDEIVLLAVT
ncbi:formate dehydrogenase subunit delta, partial [Cupriavidus basilensis]|uniref:formate dehydrogenase subunit delta n=2 Tax=Cupriavidus TaxID=106589 RepID=UPI0023E86105